MTMSIVEKGLGCQCCGKSTNDLREYKRHSGILVRESHNIAGRRTVSYSPRFESYGDYCYPCYVAAVQNEIRGMEVIL